MADIVNRVYLDLDGEVIEANSIDEKISGNKELVRVMNRRNRGIGHHHGVPEFALTVAFPADHDLGTKFVKMLTDNTQFSTVVEAEAESGAAKTTSYLQCEIYEIGKAGKEGSSQEITLDITALDCVES